MRSRGPAEDGENLHLRQVCGGQKVILLMQILTSVISFLPEYLNKISAEQHLQGSPPLPHSGIRSGAGNRDQLSCEFRVYNSEQVTLGELFWQLRITHTKGVCTHFLTH